jgi:hypothetical protein
MTADVLAIGWITASPMSIPKNRRDHRDDAPMISGRRIQLASFNELADSLPAMKPDVVLMDLHRLERIRQAR